MFTAGLLEAGEGVPASSPVLAAGVPALILRFLTKSRRSFSLRLGAGSESFRDNRLNIINYLRLFTGSCGVSRAEIRLRCSLIDIEGFKASF